MQVYIALPREGGPLPFGRVFRKSPRSGKNSWLALCSAGADYRDLASRAAAVAPEELAAAFDHHVACRAAARAVEQYFSSFYRQGRTPEPFGAFVYACDRVASINGAVGSDARCRLAVATTDGDGKADLCLSEGLEVLAADLTERSVTRLDPQPSGLVGESCGITPQRFRAAVDTSRWLIVLDDAEGGMVPEPLLERAGGRDGTISPQSILRRCGPRGALCLYGRP